MSLDLLSLVPGSGPVFDPKRLAYTQPLRPNRDRRYI